MPEERPAEPKSFWVTLPGLLTGFAAVCGAIATLVTALFSTGLIGKSKPEAPPTPVHTLAPAPAPPPRTGPDEPSRAELEETRRKLQEATRAREQAEAARAKADADAARLRQQQATAAAEAQRQSELQAARRKAEEAETARARAEAEIARLRRESAAGDSRAATPVDPGRPAPGYDNAPTRDAVVSYRVLSVAGEELDVEIVFSYDPRVHGDRILAGVHLLHEGKIITGYKPTAALWQRGKAVVRVVVRTARGRESDALEVFLYKSGERPFLTRRFPYVRTFG